MFKYLEFNLRGVDRFAIQQVFGPLGGLYVQTVGLDQGHRGGQFRQADTAGQQQSQQKCQVAEDTARRQGQHRQPTVGNTQVLTEAASYKGALGLADHHQAQGGDVNCALLGGLKFIGIQLELSQSLQRAPDQAPVGLRPVDVIGSKGKDLTNDYR